MYNLGIDLGGMSIKAAIVDENYAIVGEKVTVVTDCTEGAERIMDDIALAGKTAVEKAGLTLADIANIGIGSPGAINLETGLLEFSGNLGIDNYPMAQALEQRFGKKVHIGNDANAAAVGEVLAGAGKGASTGVCVTLGTGVGSGIIIDGKLYLGANYAAGEIGHTVIMVGGEQCTCGRKGCWEVYASATGLMRQTRAAMQANPDSLMWKLSPVLEEVNGRTSFDAMRQGDKTATEVVRQYVRYVACGITNIINTFQPDVICIGGGISKEGAPFLEMIMEEVNAERFAKKTAKPTRVVIATLGNDAGIIGAANLYAAQ